MKIYSFIGSLRQFIIPLSDYISKAQRPLFFTAALLLIFWSGRLSVQYQLHRRLPPIQPVGEVNEHVSTLTVVDIEQGTLIASTNDPQLRLISGEHTLLPDENLEFELELTHLGYLGDRRPIVKHEIPEWANFVASKSGKYFYEIDEKSAKRLSPANRNYFATAEDAKNAGFLERSRR